MGGGRAWVSGSLQPLSECGCSSRRRKTVPPSGCRVAVFPLPTPCAAGRLSISVGAQAPSRRCAAPKVKSVGLYAYTRFSTNSLSSQSSMFVELSLRVRRVSRTQGQLLARHQGCKQHRASVGGGYSLVTAECGDGAWCVIQQKNYFEIRCHLNLLPT
jgi:hypothetical protein